jgi:hypothetical protein
MIVPPWPSVAILKLAVEYWPSSVRLAVCVPSVTVSVPLVLPAASVNFTLVPVPNVMSTKSIASVTPAGEAKPAIVPENVWEKSSSRTPPLLVKVTNAKPPA